MDDTNALVVIMRRMRLAPAAIDNETLTTEEGVFTVSKHATLNHPVVTVSQVFDHADAPDDIDFDDPENLALDAAIRYFDDCDVVGHEGTKVQFRLLDKDHIQIMGFRSRPTVIHKTQGIVAEMPLTQGPHEAFSDSERSIRGAAQDGNHEAFKNCISPVVGALARRSLFLTLKPITPTGRPQSTQKLRPLCRIYFQTSPSDSTPLPGYNVLVIHIHDTISVVALQNNAFATVNFFYEHDLRQLAFNEFVDYLGLLFGQRYPIKDIFSSRSSAFDSLRKLQTINRLDGLAPLLALDRQPFQEHEGDFVVRYNPVWYAIYLRMSDNTLAYIDVNGDLFIVEGGALTATTTGRCVKTYKQIQQELASKEKSAVATRNRLLDSYRQELRPGDAPGGIEDEDPPREPGGSRTRDGLKFY